MKHRILIRVSCCLFLILGSPSQAHAIEWLVINPLDIDLLATYNARISVNQNRERSHWGVLDTSVAVTQTGYILDPGIANFSVQLEPTYSFGHFSAQGQTSRASDPNLNYDLSLLILGDATFPVSSDIRSSRRTITTNGALGSFSRGTIDEQFLGLRWRNAYFPASLGYSNRHFEQVYSSGLNDQVSKRDYVYRKLELKANSRPMRLTLKAVRSEDRSINTNNDYDQLFGNLLHQLKWGKGSSLRSVLDYQKRSGINPFEQSKLYEVLNIRHGNSIHSETFFELTSIEQDVKSKVKQFRFELFHDLYQNLRSSVYLRDNSIKSSVSDLVDRQTGFSVRYNKSPLSGMNLSTFINAYYGDTRLDSRAGFIQIVDEGHVVPPVGDFLLDRRFAILSSVVVTDTTGAFVYQEGIDYELRAEAEGFTRLLVMPDGQINVGDLLLVNYSIEPLPSSQYTTLGTRFGLNFSFKGFILAYTNNAQDYKQVSGSPDTFLTDRDESILDLSYSYQFPRGVASLKMQHRNTKAGELRSRSTAIEPVLSYTISPHTRLRLSLLKLNSDWQDTQQEIYTVNLRLSWNAPSGLTLEPELGAWRRKQMETYADTKDYRQDQYLTAGLAVRWAYRKIFMDLVVRQSRQSSRDELNDRDYTIVYFNLRRRFR